MASADHITVRVDWKHKAEVRRLIADLDAENARLRERADRYQEALEKIANGPRSYLDPGHVDAAARALATPDETTTSEED